MYGVETQFASPRSREVGNNFLSNPTKPDKPTFPVFISETSFFSSRVNHGKIRFGAANKQ